MISAGRQRITSGEGRARKRQKEECVLTLRAATLLRGKAKTARTCSDRCRQACSAGTKEAEEGINIYTSQCKYERVPMKILYITALITLFGVLLPHSVSAQFDELSVYVSIPQNADMTPNEMLAILESIEAGINEHSGLKIGKTIDESQLIVHTLCIRTEDYGYAVGVTALIPAAEGEAFALLS